MIVSLCINDHRNGQFQGSCDCVNVCPEDDTDGVEIDCYHRFAFLDGSRFRLGRRVFTYTGHQGWYGNWCWDTFRMKIAETVRLLEYLRQHGADIQCGPAEFFDAWKNGESLTEELLVGE